MELSDVMRTTGAVRAFTDDPIPPEVLHRVLDDARFAPSGGNQQGWHVTLVRDLALRRRLADLSTATWERYLAEQEAGFRAYNPIDPAPADLDIPEGQRRHAMLDAIEEVPEVLLVTVDLRTLAVTDHRLDRFSIVGGASLYPFVQNLLLAARNQALGGVVTTFLVASEPEVAPLISLPDDHAIAALVGLGTPVHQVSRLRRNPVESFTTIDRVDGPAFSLGS